MTTAKQYNKQIGNPVDESNKFLILHNKLHKRLLKAIIKTFKDYVDGSGVELYIEYKDNDNFNNDIPGNTYHIWRDTSFRVNDMLEEYVKDGWLENLRFFELNLIWMALCKKLDLDNK